MMRKYRINVLLTLGGLLIAVTLLANRKIDNLTSTIRLKKHWKIDTINYQNGSKEIIKKRILWAEPMSRCELKIISYMDKCGNIIRKRKIKAYMGCHGLREKKIYDRKYEPQCED